MHAITYRNLTIEDAQRIKEMNASQYIKNAWREVDGIRQLVNIDYHDLDWPNGYENHKESLENTILNGGIAIGAFDSQNKLIGFSSVNSEVFGKEYSYVLLDQLFISLEWRNKGIGKKLFFLTVNEAKKWNVDKLYICAGSSEETVAFYFRIGCIQAIEINEALYNEDPRDYQLEFSINNIE